MHDTFPEGIVTVNCSSGHLIKPFNVQFSPLLGTDYNARHVSPYSHGIRMTNVQLMGRERGFQQNAYTVEENRKTHG